MPIWAKFYDWLGLDRVGLISSVESESDRWKSGSLLFEVGFELVIMSTGNSRDRSESHPDPNEAALVLIFGTSLVKMGR